MADKPRLRFNRRKAASDYKKAVKAAANQLLKELYDEIRGEMNSSEGRKDLHRMREDEEHLFKRMVIGYAHAIIDSYGTGSKMDTSHNHTDVLDEYRASDIYNPARNGKTMVGRPAGEYTNIFGERETSTGRRAGKSVEGFYKPVSPSYAFQRAEVWFTKGNRVNEVLTQHIGRWIDGMPQYFEYR